MGWEGRTESSYLAGLNTVAHFMPWENLRDENLHPVMMHLQGALRTSFSHLRFLLLMKNHYRNCAHLSLNTRLHSEQGKQEYLNESVKR